MTHHQSRLYMTHVLQDISFRKEMLSLVLPKRGYQQMLPMILMFVVITIMDGISMQVDGGQGKQFSCHIKRLGIPCPETCNMLMPLDDIGLLQLKVKEQALCWGSTKVK